MCQRLICSLSRKRFKKFDAHPEFCNFAWTSIFFRTVQVQIFFSFSIPWFSLFLLSLSNSVPIVYCWEMENSQHVFEVIFGKLMAIKIKLIVELVSRDICHNSSQLGTKLLTLLSRHALHRETAHSSIAC
jgi:hypothetical protein